MTFLKYTFFIILIFQFVEFNAGLYQDQAGLFDWKQDYVGKVLDLKWDQSHQSAGKKFLVSTEKNVIAYLNANDGSIVWRRMFEETERGRIDAFLYEGDILISIHAGGQFVRRWQVSSGSLQWEKSLGYDLSTRASGLLVTSSDNGGDQVIVATSTGIHCLRISDGSQEWSKGLPVLSVSHWYVKEVEDGFLAVGVTPSQRVTSVNISPQGDLKTHKHTPATWIASATNCLIMEENYFVCYARDTEVLQLLDTSSGHAFIPTDLKNIGVEVSPESHIESAVPLVASTILFRSSHDAVSLLSRNGHSFVVKTTLAHTLASHVTVHGDKPFLLTLVKEKGTLVLNGRDLLSNIDVPEMTLRFPFSDKHGNPAKMYPFLFSRKKDTISRPKLIFLAQDFSLHFSQKGKSAWKREEAMAYIQAVQMVDLPISIDQAKFEDEFGGEDSLPAMFVKRIRAQVSQIAELGQRLIKQSQGYQMNDKEEEEKDLIRDNFNLHKVIVVVTSVGKIFGLRSQSGREVWQLFVPDLQPFHRAKKERFLLVVQRTTAHFPHPPQAAVLGVSKKSGNGLLVTLNPITGVANMAPQDLGYKVIQAEMLAEMDDNFLKGLLLLDADRKAHIVPPSSSVALRSPTMQPFFTLLDPDSGLMSGYRILENNGKVSLDQVWSLDLQANQQTVTGVYRKRGSEQVRSQGRVLGDRSVLYKYLNPNLAAVIAEGQEPTTTTGTKSPTNSGPFFSLYLVDLVTGHLVYSQTHKRARGPVHVIHSEHWVLYSYFSERYRRTEVGILELYEGKAQSNSTAFSSFSPPSPPLVLRQAYIFPEPIYAMDVTVTEKGITSKNVMVALKMGGILSLPKALLDPRRPVIPTRETMEEGTIPYVPEIGLSTEALVNYNQSAFQVRDVFTWPAGLESTSLVLVYGTDVFYTRVMPSRMFDVLKEDFDYLFIGSVLALMILVSMITQKLASRKGLARAWK